MMVVILATHQFGALITESHTTVLITYVNRMGNHHASITTQRMSALNGLMDVMFVKSLISMLLNGTALIKNATKVITNPVVIAENQELLEMHSHKLGMEQCTWVNSHQF